MLRGGETRRCHGAGVMFLAILVVATGTVGAAEATVTADRSDRNVYLSDDDHLTAVDADTGDVAWRTNISIVPLRAPTVVDGVVYTSGSNPNRNGTVYAVDAKNGSVRWRYDTDLFNTPSPPTVVNGTVYVGQSDVPFGDAVQDWLYALNASTGDLERTYPARSTKNTPTVVDGVVYTAGVYTVEAFDTSTGERHWRQTLPNRSNSPTVVDGLLFVTTKLGTVRALNASTGRTVWQYNMKSRSPRLQAVESLESHPVVVNETVYVESESGVFALDAASGEQRWITSSSNVYGITVADGRVYNGGENDSGFIEALDAETGRQLWRTVHPEGPDGPGMPTVAGDTLYVRGHRGSLYALNATTGTRRWLLDAEDRISHPTVADPEGGDSIDSRVMLGTLGHHDAFAEWAANQTIDVGPQNRSDVDSNALEDGDGNINDSDARPENDTNGDDRSASESDGPDDRGLPGFTAVAAVMALTACWSVVSRRR